MKFWNLLFWVAAFYNWLVGIPMFIAPDLAMAGFGTAVPEDLSLIRVAGALIFCFGVIWAMVARDPDRYKPIVWTGLFGKLGVGFVFAQDWLHGNVPVSGVITTLGQLVFLVMFIAFLMYHKPGVEAADMTDTDKKKAVEAA